jgi:hypothetical protein
MLASGTPSSRVQSRPKSLDFSGVVKILKHAFHCHIMLIFNWMQYSCYTSHIFCKILNPDSLVKALCY